MPGLQLPTTHTKKSHSIENEEEKQNFVAFFYLNANVGKNDVWILVLSSEGWGSIAVFLSVVFRFQGGSTTESPAVVHILYLSTLHTKWTVILRLNFFFNARSHSKIRI